MGRKIKPLGLHRKAISISLALDVIGHLDRMVLASDKGVTRSRIIESLVRDSMLKGQTMLFPIITTWKCSGCGFHWKTKDPSLDFVYCQKCNRQQDKRIDMKSQMTQALGPGEEE